MPDALGFIGLGNMGLPMARRLLQAGYAVTVHDIRDEAAAALVAEGAVSAASPAEVAEASDVVLLSLPTPDLVRDVALGRDGVTQGEKAKIMVDLSTTGPRTAAAVAVELAKKNIVGLDAPVSGGVAGAVKGTLAVMAAGPTEAFERVKPVLDVFGRVFYIGERAGMGQSMKLINNLLSATALAATSEAVVLGTKAGLNPDVMIEVINTGSGRNSASLDKFPRNILPRTFDAGFTVGLINKDLKLCFEEAEALQVPLWIGTAVRQMWIYALGHGGGDKDFTTVIKHFEDWAGVTVAGKAASNHPSTSER